LPAALAIFAIVVAFIAQYRISNDLIASVQLQQQEDIAGYDVGPILKKLQPVLKRDDVLLTEFALVRWFPGMMDLVALCTSTSKICIRNAVSDPPRDRVFVLILRGALEYPSLNTLLKPEKRMAESGGFELYGPFSAMDVAAIN
jgi:hypothetical protein